MKNTEKQYEKIVASILVHSKESWAGNHAAANRAFRSFTRAVCSQLAGGSSDILLRLAESEHPAVRHVGGYFLLPIDRKRAEKTLRALRRERADGVGFNTRMLLEQWKKGTLKFPRMVSGRIVYLGADELIC